jgi:acetyl esterase/lipase
MFKFLLVLIVLFALFVASRIYRFFKRTNAPILQGKLHCSVNYKKGKSLDIYQPTRAVFDKSPVVVFFHGGGWVFGTKKMVNNARFNVAFNTLRDQGYAIVSPGYTLAKSGKSPFPACIEDAVDALAWLATHADQYGFDLDNVGVMGESAGAHIGLMASYSKPDAFSQGHSVDIKYVVDVYGPTSMHQLYSDLKPFLVNFNARISTWPSLLQNRFDVTKNLFGFDPEAEPERAKVFMDQFSPYLQAHANAPTTLIIHGERDPLVPVSQSYMLKERLEEVAVPHQMYIIQGMGHSFRGASLNQRQRVQEWITEFVMQNYRQVSDLLSPAQPLYGKGTTSGV